MLATVATVCTAETSQHDVTVIDPAALTPGHVAVILAPGDCYTGTRITLRVPATYKVDAHAPSGSAWTGDVSRSRLRQPGCYHLSRHRHGDTILVRVY